MGGLGKDQLAIADHDQLELTLEPDLLLDDSNELAAVDLEKRSGACQRIAGRTEAINGLIELHRRVARGFRNYDNYRLRMLLIGGGPAHPHLK